MNKLNNELIKTKRKAIIYNSLVYSFLILLFILTLFPSIENDFKSITTDKVYNANIEYINSASNRSLVSLATIAVLKGVVAIGNIIPVVSGFIMPIQDFLSVAWKAVLYSAISLQIFYYFLILFHHIEFILLSIFIFVLILYRLSVNFSPYTWINNFLKSLSRFSLLIVLFTWIVFPLSIQGSKLLSEVTTKNLMKNANRELAQIKKELISLDFKDEKTKLTQENTTKQNTTKKDHSNKNSKPKNQDVSSKVSNFISNLLKDIKNSVVNKASEIKKTLAIKGKKLIKNIEFYSIKIKNYSIIIIASYILDCLIFPLLIIFLFIWFLKILKQQFISVENEKTMKSLLKTLKKG